MRPSRTFVRILTLVFTAALLLSLAAPPAAAKDSPRDMGLVSNPGAPNEAGGTSTSVHDRVFVIRLPFVGAVHTRGPLAKTLANIIDFIC